MKKLFNRFKYAFGGIAYALRHDGSYQWQFYAGAIFVTAFFLIAQPLTQTEVLFLGLSWALVLITELQNSSFESALDHLHPELHENIGRSKDMAAGAVLTAGLFMAFVVAMIVLF